MYQPKKSKFDSDWLIIGFGVVVFVGALVVGGLLLTALVLGVKWLWMHT